MRRHRADRPATTAEPPLRPTHDDRTIDAVLAHLATVSSVTEQTDWRTARAEARVRLGLPPDPPPLRSTAPPPASSPGPELEPRPTPAPSPGPELAPIAQGEPGLGPAGTPAPVRLLERMIDTLDTAVSAPPLRSAATPASTAGDLARRAAATIGGHGLGHDVRVTVEVVIDGAPVARTAATWRAPRLGAPADLTGGAGVTA